MSFYRYSFPIPSALFKSIFKIEFEHFFFDGKLKFLYILKVLIFLQHWLICIFFFLQIQSTELDGLDGSELSEAGLTVDARPFKSGTRVYAGGVGVGHLTAFDPARGVWYRVPLDLDPRDRVSGDGGVTAECVAVSRSQSYVFFTSARSHDLYSASFRHLRNLTSRVTPATMKVFPGI